MEEYSDKSVFRDKRSVRWEQVGNNKNSQKKYYFNKKAYIIDKLIWMFCENNGIKQKK